MLQGSQGRVGGDAGDCERHAVVDWLVGDCGDEGGHEWKGRGGRHFWKALRVRRWFTGYGGLGF